MHYELIKKSLKDLDKRLIILVILQNAIILGLLYAFLYINGLTGLMAMQNFTKDQIYEILAGINARIIISGFFALVLAFIINSMLVGLRLNLTREIVQRKRAISGIFELGNSEWIKVAMLKLLMFLIVFFASAAIILIAYLASLVNGSLTIALLVVLIIIAAVLFLFGLLFSYAIMFLLDTTPWNAIKKSFRYFFSNKGLAVITFLILVLAALPASLISALDALKIQWLSLLVFAVRTIYGLVLAAWNDLFIFNIYAKKMDG